jgi:23S rRNA pseudouridine2605 synthase
VRVNGRVAGLGDSARAGVDEVSVDGVALAREPAAYWVLHKPRGVVTTLRDPEGRRTVLDLLPGGAPRLFPVGRLDRDTEGLLLLTNDGRTAHALLHPSHESEREYRVSVRGRIGAAELRQLAEGVELEEGRTARAGVGAAEFDAQAGLTRFSLVLTEGRKRQIRRSLEALGHPVARLVRVRLGPLRLGRLASGEARALTDAERSALLAEVARAERRATTSPERRASR